MRGLELSISTILLVDIDNSQQLLISTMELSILAIRIVDINNC